ncbi:sensor histidine kinase [Parapedobacter indicus]|uniref:Histidine kinase n=1 Tax=Parapedobacter indicus TaxID=1477437 RepID=A0A1I3T8C7_9SPHI|nr:histidine kinase [Parapedobacter indicus]PPK99591.1 histidine kinase [Parapedobacter indicus]SFJ67195.1 Histidine kinase [Parapedobacter indicus]
MQDMVSLETRNGLTARRPWIYVAYWGLVTLIFLYDRTYLIEKAGLPNFFICSAVRVTLLIGLAWLNIHWLIPRYLLRGRYGSYFGLVFVLIIGYLVVQSLYDYYLFGYVLGPNRNVHLSASLIYNFTHTSLYLLLTVALKFSIDWYVQREMLQEAQVGKLQAEVNYLRSQVNPHFLFNALNNLYALTLKKSEEAPDVVLKLAELMEYMLYESDEPYVPLAREINYLSNYLELEKIRQSNQADIRMTVTGTADRCRIPPFLILPLVENAFKHGIGKAAFDAYLYIDIQINQTLEVRIANSKPPFEEKEKNGGIGLLNLRKRLELLYPANYLLQITEQPDRYEVFLKIDLLC